LEQRQQETELLEEVRRTPARGPGQARDRSWGSNAGVPIHREPARSGSRDARPRAAGPPAIASQKPRERGQTAAGAWGKETRRGVSILPLDTISTKELKDAIQKKLDEVPDTILQEVLENLRGFQAKEQKRLVGLKRILDEKRDLLLRLAK